MPTADELKQRIESAIPDASAEVESPDDVHFTARVVSPAFAGKSFASRMVKRPGLT